MKFKLDKTSDIKTNNINFLNFFIFQRETNNPIIVKNLFL